MDSILFWHYQHQFLICTRCWKYFNSHWVIESKLHPENIDNEQEITLRLQDTGTLLRGHRTEHTVGAAKGLWGVLACSADRGREATLLCPGCVHSRRQALCVVRQLGHIPRVVASVHSRWELEEVGWMSHFNGKHQVSGGWLCLSTAKEGLCFSDGVRYQILMLTVWTDLDQSG